MEDITTKSELKRNRADQAIRRKNTRTIFWVVGISIVLGALAVWIFLFNRQRVENLPGVLIEDQGREHVQVGASHPSYNSNPPTSGWHYGNPAEWGAYKEALPDGVVIHNLEHGGVWISYKPDISGELREELEGFYEEWGRKVIVTPRPQNDTDIALAAWNRLDTFSEAEYTKERVNRFIKAFRNKGPEFVP